MSMKNIF